MSHEATLYYINWSGKINNKMEGTVDLVGGISSKEHALSMLEDMKKRYRRGKVVLRTKPVWKYLEEKTKK